MDFDILSAEFFADPHPTLAAMRRDYPCWYDSRLDAHVITRYSDIARVLQDEKFSAQRVSQFGRGAPEHQRAKLDVYNHELERWLLFCDPPVHSRLRGRLGRAFGAHLVPAIERYTAAAVAEAVARLADVEAPDLVRDLAYPVPTRVLADLIGIATADIERFKYWTTEIFALIGAGVADEAAVDRGYRGVVELRAYVLELLADRRAHPRGDVLSALAAPQTEPDGSVISDDDLVGLFMTLIVAGHETTTNLIANGLHGILSDPRSRAWVLSRGRLDDKDVDELIRFDGPVFSLIRRARQDVTVAGTLIRAGECVLSMLNAGNRDPRQFLDPDRLDFERRGPAHLGLGIGIHACMGAMMARVTASAAVSGFLRAYPDAAIAPGCAWQRNMSIRGLTIFPVELRGSSQHSSPRTFAALLAAHPGVREGQAASQRLPDLAENCPRRVDGVLAPRDTDAVREVVLAANAHGVPLYPFSAGKNWGLGSRSPVLDGGVLLDLSGMDRIRTLDLDRGIAVIEPGVTQGMLADRLEDTPFLLNVTTSCRDTSVVGNALDGGQGMLRLRRDELLGVEVVLGNGSVITTGGVGPAAERAFFATGSGPDLTRLFCQSSFGVVTAAAIELVPRPEQTCFVYAAFRGDALAAAVDRLAALRREHVVDRMYYLSEMQIGAGAAELPDFTLLGPVMGRRGLVREALDIVRSELASVPGCKSVRAGAVRELEPGDPLYHRGRAFLGIPTCESLRARFGVSSCALDESSRQGWSVLQTVLPLDGRSVHDALMVLKAGVDAHGIPVQPHLSSVSSRAMNLMTMIWFERSTAGIERMRALRDALQADLLARGLFPSREGIDMLRASHTRGPRDAGWAQLKAALDPNGVIAPGRYA